jgi:hypothetical protein
VVLPGTADAAEERPVFRWERFGGFVAPGTDPLAAPRLTVYSDGLAVADATRSMWLNGRVKAEIQHRAVDVLSHPANLHRRSDAPVIVDAPQTRFTAGRHTGVVDALEEYRGHHGYPKPLYDLLDDAAALRERVLDNGKLFRPAAVRLVVVRLDEPPPGRSPRPWPVGVAIPPIDANGRTGQANVYGPAARRVIAGIGVPPSGTWQAFRTRRGAVLQTAWRYLLPDERPEDFRSLDVEDVESAPTLG